MRINYTLNNNIITGYTIVPFDNTKPYLDLTQEEIDSIRVGYTRLIDNKLLYNEDIYQLILKTKKELSEIQNWFKENDWKINKIVIGEWTQDDERWTDYLKERKIKRERQDELNKILNSNL